MRDLYPNLPSEPVPIADGSPAPGSARWLLSLLYDAESHGSDLLVLDADTLDTVARLRLPHHVPPGFHGNFVPADALAAVAGAKIQT
jgi:carotenoid cleavage dioxygenase